MPSSLDYPHNLLAAIRGRSRELPAVVTSDMEAGLSYALSTLDDAAQTLLRLYYQERHSLPEISAILSVPTRELELRQRAALEKLRRTFRWNYIRYGVSGYLKKTKSAQYSKGYYVGFFDGYQRGAEDARLGLPTACDPDSPLDQPIEALNLSHRAYNILHRTGYRYIRDLTTLDELEIYRIRNLGTKTADEVAKKLQAMGISHTNWCHFLL